MEIVLVLAVLFGIVTAAIASGRGRNGLGWFFIGALLGIFGVIIAAVLPKIDGE